MEFLGSFGFFGSLGGFKVVRVVFKVENDNILGGI